MTARPARPRLRPLALPSEHGGWVLLAAPVLAGLAVHPSVAGAFIGVSGVGAFLARHPLRIALNDLRHQKRYPRTTLALCLAGGYASVALVGLYGATACCVRPFWSALAVGAALGLVQFGFDLFARGRRFVPLACGAAALATLATAILEAAGELVLLSSTIGAVLALQSICAVLYASTRLRLERGSPASVRTVLIMHGLSLLAVSVSCSYGLVGWWVVLAFVVFLVRAVWGLSPRRLRVKTALVGLQEVGYSLLGIAAVVWSAR